MRPALIGVCGLRGHKTWRQARNEGGRLNAALWRRMGVKNAREHEKNLAGGRLGVSKIMDGGVRQGSAWWGVSGKIGDRVDSFQSVQSCQTR